MIFISAGHNEFGKGARYGDFLEHDEALIWLEIIESYNHPGIIKVPPGRLKNKIQFINDNCNSTQGEIDIAVEIHFNSAIYKGKHVGEGCESLYCPKSRLGKELASSINEELAKIFLPNRGVKEGYYKMDKKSGKIDAFLSRTNCPASIVEPDFIHRKDKIIKSRDAGSNAIILGCLNFITNNLLDV